MLLAFPLSDLRDLCNNYVDLRMQAIQMKDDTCTVMENMREESLLHSVPTDYKLVPVALPNNNGYTYAKVSPEDYEIINKPEFKWRRSATGFALFVKRNGDDFVSTYMHIMVHGSHARHVNGDRLDNRRTNLVTGRSPPVVRTRKRERDEDLEDEEFVLHTPRVVAADMYKFHYKDEDLKNYTGFGEIEYKSGEKIYSGEICDGRPHGYGHLYETTLSTQSCGNWVRGRMMEGMVLVYKDLPQCYTEDCEGLKQCPHREVLKLELVKGGYKEV